MSGSVRIVTSGQTLTVNITRPDGSAATAYTDGTLSTSLAFPQTISSDTSYYFSASCGLVVSTKLNGTEIAGGLNVTIPVFIEDGQQRVVDPANKTPDVFGFSALATTKGLHGARVVAIGDSITATCCDATNGVQSDSWLTSFCLASGGRALHLRNSGVGGNTTAQMAARFQTDVVAYKPDTVIIFGGTNDSLDSNSLPTSTATSIKAMVAAARAVGIRPILCTIPPAGTAALGPISGAPTVSVSATGGNVPAGSYFYAVTAVNGVGETLIGNLSATVNPTGSTSSITVVWPAKPGALGYNIYRNGGPNYQKVGSVTASGNTWTPPQSFVDTAASGPIGTPSSDTTAQAISTAVRLKIARVNAWIRAYAFRNGLDLIDFYSMLVDPTTGLYQTGLTRDGTHPTPQASRLMGSTAWTQIGATFGQATPYVVQEANDPLNLMSNGLFYTNSGGLPASWSSYGGNASNFTDTVGTVSGINGLAFTTSRSDNTPRYHGGPLITTGFSVGDTIACCLRLKTTSVESSNCIVSVGIAYNGATAAPSNAIAAQLTADISTPGLLYAESVVPPGTTALAPTQNISNNTGTIVSGEWTVLNLTTGALLSP